MKKVKSKLINGGFHYFNYVMSSLVAHLPVTFRQFPIVLHIRPTSKCNLSCPFCYLKEGLNQKEENTLNIEEWREILKQLPRTTIVDITGAEPLLARNFAELLKLLKEFKLKASITTNGTVGNDLILKLLSESSVEYLMISLDGLESVHNKLRGDSNAFQKTTEFIRKIKANYRADQRPLINLKVMLLDENCEDLIPLLRFCQNTLKPDLITINVPFLNQARGGLSLEDDFNSPKFHSGNTFQYKNPSKVLGVLNEIFEIEKTFPMPIVFKPTLSKKNLVNYVTQPQSLRYGKCPLHKNNLTLYYDGSVTPCDIGYCIGNIRNVGFDISQIFRMDRFLHFKKAMESRNEACQGCVFTRKVISP